MNEAKGTSDEPEFNPPGAAMNEAEVKDRAFQIQSGRPSNGS